MSIPNGRVDLLRRTAPRTASTLLVVAVLTGHASLLAWSGWRHTPVVPEGGHLAAGVSHLRLGRFDLFRVNPPLVRTVAAVPVCLGRPATNWNRYDCSPLKRSWSPVGVEFLYANGSRSFWLVTMARWACIPFSLLGAYLCFRWAGELYGTSSGLLALLLWCFSPYLLGHAPLITADAHAAALGLAAGYVYWLWLKDPSWPGCMVAGVVLGLAQLAKLTLLAFYPLWLLLWIIYRASNRRATRRLGWLDEGAMFSTIMLLSVLVINLGYGLEGSSQQLGAYRFQSRTLTGVNAGQRAPEGGANRFADTWLAALPVPLPKNYLQGIDTQKWDVERQIPSYLRGRRRSGGWWYFYLYALAIKVPLGTWVLVLLAMVLGSLASGYAASWRDEAVVLLPLVAILLLVSSQTGFTLHSRYVLPILPFAFVWVSKVARSVALRQRTIFTIGALALCWTLASSLWVYPHSLSYFNEFVGGPRQGHAHLLDSNVSWGQDFSYLKLWLDAHPHARPFHLAAYGNLNARLAEIQYAVPSPGCISAGSRSRTPGERLGPLPGWYAIDVNYLYPAESQGADKGCSQFAYFRRFQPVASAGYSIYIYHVTLDEAIRVRRELGLPALPSDL